MKKLILFSILFSAFSFVDSFGQNWSKLDKIKYSDLTLKDYQETFNKYWDGYNVKNGYYINSRGKKVKAGGWKRFKRWENYWMKRVNPITGKFPSTADWDTITNQIQKEKENYNSIKYFSGNWGNYGPYTTTNGNPYGDGNVFGVGRINCIEFHPTDPNTFWVGTPTGGLWETKNGGQTWKVLTDQNQLLGVSSIAIPSDFAISKTMYIATGDRNDITYAGIGILKSTNAGLTWESTGLSYNPAEKKIVNKLLISPNNNNKLYAASTNGFFISTNAGVSWKQTLSEELIDIEFNPANSNIIYGATRKSSKIFKSNDAGQNWSLIESFSNAGRIELTVSSADASIVYAVVVNNAPPDSAKSLKGIYISTNKGDSYQLVFDGTTSNHNLLGYDSDGSGSGGQGDYDLALEANPNNANEVYLGGIITWKTTNGGNNWKISNNAEGETGKELVHVDKHFIKFNNNSIYECNDGGLYKSTDNGMHWKVISDGIKNSQVYRIGLSKTNGDELLAGQQDGGAKLFHSNTEWEDASFGDGQECIITSNEKYAALQSGEVLRISDLTIITNNIEGGASGAWTTPFIVDPNNDNTLYIGYWDIYKTTDRGNTWTPLYNYNVSDYLQSIAIANSNPDVIYEATYKNIWKSIDGGKNWAEIKSGLPVSQSNITYISIKDNDPNTVWVSLSGYNQENVYKTIDGGNNWINISSGIPDIPVNTIIQNKSITDFDQLFAGTDFGVYVKNENEDWKPFKTNFPSVIVNELEIFYGNTKEDNWLYAGTFGRGVWRTRLTCSDNIVITKQPVSISASLGDNTSFSIKTNNTGLNYQWYLDDFSLQNTGRISGANSYELKIKNINNNDFGFYNCKVSNDCSQVISEYAELFSYTNTQEISIGEIKLYPNPNNGKFKIELSKKLIGTNFKIIDIHGQIILKSVFNKKVKTIDIRKYNKGIYIITFDIENKPVSMSFFKE